MKYTLIYIFLLATIIMHAGHASSDACSNYLSHESYTYGQNQTIIMRQNQDNAILTPIKTDSQEELAPELVSPKTTNALNDTIQFAYTKKHRSSVLYNDIKPKPSSFEQKTFTGKINPEQKINFTEQECPEGTKIMFPRRENGLSEKMLAECVFSVKATNASDGTPPTEHKNISVFPEGIADVDNTADTNHMNIPKQRSTLSRFFRFSCVPCWQ